MTPTCWRRPKRITNPRGRGGPPPVADPGPRRVAAGGRGSLERLDRLGLHPLMLSHKQLDRVMSEIEAYLR